MQCKSVKPNIARSRSHRFLWFIWCRVNKSKVTSVTRSCQTWQQLVSWDNNTTSSLKGGYRDHLMLKQVSYGYIDFSEFCLCIDTDTVTFRREEWSLQVNAELRTSYYSGEYILSEMEMSISNYSTVTFINDAYTFIELHPQMKGKCVSKCNFTPR